VAARLARARAAFDAEYCSADSPFQRAPWYPLQAIPKVARARRRVAMSSMMRSLLSLVPPCDSENS
jgi:hypothetical protein